MENELENLEKQEISPAKPRRRKASSEGFKAQPSPTVEEVLQPEPSPEPEPLPVVVEEPAPTQEPEPVVEPEPTPVPVAEETPAPVDTPTKRQRHDRIRKPLKVGKGNNNNGLRIRF